MATVVTWWGDKGCEWSRKEMRLWVETGRLEIKGTRRLQCFHIILKVLTSRETPLLSSPAIVSSCAWVGWIIQYLLFKCINHVCMIHVQEPCTTCHNTFVAVRRRTVKLLLSSLYLHLGDQMLIFQPSHFTCWDGPQFLFPDSIDWELTMCKTLLVLLVPTDTEFNKTSSCSFYPGDPLNIKAEIEMKIKYYGSPQRVGLNQNRSGRVMY